MKRVKTLAVAILALATLIVVLQNQEPIPIRILFFEPVEIPAALLLFTTGLSGFVLGMTASLFFGRKKKVPSSKFEPPDVPRGGPSEGR